MIGDARRSNRHFREPDYVHLCTGGALSRIEIDEGSELTIWTADEDAFYHLALPEDLRGYFTLAPIDGKFLKGACPDLAVLPGHKYYPQLAVVPMGWSWALYICQSLHEQIVRQAQLDDGNRLRDKLPCPSHGLIHTEYVDNLVVMGTQRDQVISAFQLAVHALKEAGLQVHEDEICKGDTCVLGWQFTADGKFGPSAKRLWKVRLAIKGILRRRRSSGRDVERLVGHASFISLARRGSLSIFGEVYRFIQRHRDQAGEFPIPRAVRRELETWSGGEPQGWLELRRDCRRCKLLWFWGDYKHLAFGESPRTWQVNERWRFAGKNVQAPRSTAQDVVLEPQVEPGNEMHDGSAMSSGKHVNQEFEPVPFSVVDREWTTLTSFRWSRVPTLPVGEARGAPFAVKHALRAIHNFGKRHLILTDSMTAAGSLSRGDRVFLASVGFANNLGLCNYAVAACSNFAGYPSRGIWEPSKPRLVSHGDPSKSPHQPL